MTAGRPRAEFKPEYCDMVIKHMERGFSFESFAGVLGCSKELLYSFVERHPEFADAKREAFERSRLFWENIAIDNIVEHNIPGEGSRKLNSTAWIFNMKNRFGWTDKQEVQQNISGELAIGSIAEQIAKKHKESGLNG